MWWKLTGLAALAAAFVALLFWPVLVDIRVDLPAPSTSGGENSIDPVIVLKAIYIIVNVIVFAFAAGVLGLIAWLMWRVVRHHRALKNTQA